MFTLSHHPNTIPKFRRLLFGLTLIAFASSLWAAKKPPVEYSVAEVFVELNNTDEDLGIHALIDGEPWKTLEIKSPDGKRLLKTRVSNQLKKQGLTEFFFESAEPNFEDLSPAEFFDRFAEGLYQVKGKSLAGDKLQSSTLFTHNIPAPPVTRLNGMTDIATECDEDEEGYDPLELTTPVTISWDAVTSSHPDLGGLPVNPVDIHNYEVVVEIELEIDGEEFASVLSVILPPDQLSVTLPDDFMNQADGHVKYEVLAREASYNQTAVESCFEVEED